MFIFETERDGDRDRKRAQTGEGQREGDTELKAGFRLSAQNVTRA